jgi:hypothetical protein
VGQADSEGDAAAQADSLASGFGSDFGFDPFLKSVAYQPLPFN